LNTLKDLYRDTIRQHAANPVGLHRPIDATHRYEGHNPQCGDRVEIMMKIGDGMIEDIAFEGEACTICTASTSLLCENIAGRSTSDFSAMKAGLEKNLKDREGSEDIGPLAPLLGVRPYPSRVQCATLPWSTVERAIKEGAL
jgi:nitrogen fixation NifU-like protein